MRLARYLPLLLLPALVGAADKPKATKPAPPPAIAKVAWLTGNWRLEREGRLVEEQWMTPAGGVMLAMGRTLAKGKIVEHKFLQIREGPGGDLFLVAQVSGHKDATYQVKGLTETTVNFENTLNDFPQSVSFTLRPEGTMVETLAGPGTDGVDKKVEYVFLKAAR